MHLPRIELSRLLPHPNNPRGDLGDLTELAESIKARGIQQNLTVVPVDVELYQRKVAGKKAYTGNFTVVIGHRRSAAAKLAGLAEVPCRIATDMDLKDQVAVMLAENMQRKELTLLEEAQGMQLMLDLGDSVEDVSKKTGLSKSTVYGRLKIVKTFGKEAIERVQGRPIELGDYEKMYKIENPEKRAEVFEQVGTKEFDWALNSAINAQKKEAQKEQLIRIISEFATETTYDEYHKARKSQYWNYYRYDQKELEAVQELANAAKPAGHLEGVELFYSVSEGYLGINIYAMNEDADSKSDERNAAKQLESERKEAKKTQIKGMFKQAYEMRISFVKRFTATTETSEAVNKMATFALFSMRYPIEDTVRTLLGIDKKFRQTHEKGDGETRDQAINRIMEEHSGVVSKGALLLKGAYSRIEPGNVSCIDDSGKYTPSESLALVYDYLKSIGYVTSEEEERLISGTHDVYVSAEESK